MSSPEFTIDQKCITEFVDTVFGYLDGYVPVRLLNEIGTAKQPPYTAFVPPTELATELTSVAERAAGSCRGVFVVPGTVSQPGSAKASDIAQSAALLIDLDDGDIASVRSNLQRHLGDASLVVASGGRTAQGQEKLHLYWKLTEPIENSDLQRLVAARKLLADKAGGDPSFGSLHQPIRVPGTIHSKNGHQTPVRILARSRREYELSELEEALATMPAVPGARTTKHRKAGPTLKQLAVDPVRAGGTDSITRFEAASKVIGHWVRNARVGTCTSSEAWNAVQDYNAAMLRPPWEEERLRREFDALARKDALEHKQVGHAPSDNADDVTPPDLSDDALAGAFVERAGEDWRFVRGLSIWLRWNGEKWHHDERGQVREEMRLVCRRAACLADTPTAARRVASEKTISAALRLAETDPALATAPSDWDNHPLLLNTPRGIVDLATGEAMPHERRRFLTQATAASPEGDCPQWRSFLDRVTAGDADLQAYLARLAGYCLTGKTSEQVFVFLHGHGANGKSVFLQTLADVLGDYAATATLDTFMASRSSRHLTELAGLKAARLVLVPETQPGRNWDEGRIKTVTGGERVRANFMYKDHFEFAPQFKLLIAGNHRPSLSTVGEAMRRRLHLVPFEVTIPPDERDTDLGSKLVGERAGILKWMLDGCADWQRLGLAPPANVLAAANDYFDSEDLVGQWLEECCVVSERAKIASAILYASWKTWAENGGFDPGSQKLLGEALRARGFRNGKIKGARGWYGLCLTNHAHREAAE